ncbi:MAG: hypothetical protein AB7W28_07135 [Armatimonadota bacterium]
MVVGDALVGLVVLGSMVLVVFVLTPVILAVGCGVWAYRRYPPGVRGWYEALAAASGLVDTLWLMLVCTDR